MPAKHSRGLDVLSVAPEGFLGSSSPLRCCWWLLRLTVHEHPFARAHRDIFSSLTCLIFGKSLEVYALRLLSEHITEGTDNWLSQRSWHFTIKMCKNLIAITPFMLASGHGSLGIASIMASCLFLQFPWCCQYWTYETGIIFWLGDA